MDSSSSKIVLAASSVFQEVDTVDDKLLSLPRLILKLELMFIFGTLPRPPDSDLKDGFWFNLRSMSKICIQLQDVSGLSYFFTSLVLRNQALLCASRDSDSEVRYHLACGKRDDISGYALRQGELIWLNNIMELASLILANEQSSFEVLFSLDKQKAAATLVFWTRYNGFRASVSLICEAYLLSVAAGIWLVASLPLREAYMSNNEFNLLKQFCVPVLHLSSSEDEFSSDFKPLRLLGASVLNLIRLSARILLIHRDVFQSLSPVSLQRQGLYVFSERKASSRSVSSQEDSDFSSRPATLQLSLVWFALGFLDEQQVAKQLQCCLKLIQSRDVTAVYVSNELIPVSCTWNLLGYILHTVMLNAIENGEYLMPGTAFAIGYRDSVCTIRIIVARSGWLRSILDLLHCSLPRPPEVLCDSF